MGNYEWPDDFVIVFTSERSPGTNTIRVSTAQHAFHLVEKERDHLWTITRLGREYIRSEIFAAAVAEGMERDARRRLPFDFQEALRNRYGEWPLRPVAALKRRARRRQNCD